MTLLITLLSVIGGLTGALAYARRNNPGCRDIEEMRLVAVAAYHRYPRPY